MSLETEFERVWPWLDAALRHGRQSDLTKADLKAAALAGKAMLWPGERAVLLTECIVTAEGRFLHCWLGGGDLNELLALRRGVEAWGRAMGCEFASIDGRKGWDRVFRPFGYARVGDELRKVLL